ncbi:prenyltransferase [Echinicola strongylocentroti]|uniref:Prenyltransferase n=1 Tax=Echinicola strongylocentroti TaxID=1795355 RepID=A0A2Z4IIC9_9BACT|nr:geranylgeranylglycerol-phosphate geranylgeranyltransferase [Echinicola strongylocentroti]AWW30665.1 prenyltransferase [Echinicola strongylocentroti]
MNHMPSAERAFSLPAFLRIIRTDNLLMMAFAQLMTAYFLVGETLSGIPALLDPSIYLLITSTVLIAAAGYLINDYYDVKIDYINKPDEVIIGKGMRRRVVMFLHTFLNIAGIGLACLVSLKVGVTHFGAAFILWLYSNTLKRLPFVGNLAVATLTGLAIWMVGFYFGQSRLLVLTYAVFAFFINLIREIIKDIEDREGDRKHGCKTLPIVLGFRATKNIIFVIAAVFVCSILIVAYKVDETLLYVYFGFIGMLFIYFMSLIYQADRKAHFTRLSLLSKILMLTGVLSMAFL